MVNESLNADNISQVERRLALAYAPRERRALLTALFGLDDALASILRTTREPMVGQMRLTWWYNALTAIDAGPPPAEPVLQALARDALPCGIGGAQAPASAPLLPEQGAEDGCRVQTRQAQPVHAPLTGHQCRGAAVAEDGVVLDRDAHAPIMPCRQAFAASGAATHSGD